MTSLPGRALLATLSCLSLWPPSAAAITGDEIIGKMQESFAKHKTFSAKFEKQFYWALLDSQQKSRKGRIFTRRPSQFRLELEQGDLVVANGASIWSYNRLNEQVIVSAYDYDLKTPWEILLDYSSSHTPIAVNKVELAGNPCYEISLEPKAGRSQIAHLKIWVHSKQWHLLKVEQVEANENITTYLLEDHQTNKKLDDELFQFEVPEGVEVIDRRASSSAQ